MINIIGCKMWYRYRPTKQDSDQLIQFEQCVKLTRYVEYVLSKGSGIIKQFGLDFALFST